MIKVRHPKLVLIFTIVIIILSFISFLAFKKPNNNYVSLEDEIKTMNSAQLNIDATISKINLPTDVSSDLVSTISDSSKRFTKALKSAKNTPFKDDNVKAVFNENKNSLDNYSVSIQSLTNSLGQYVLVSSLCSELIQGVATFATLKDFNTASTDCSTIIQDTKSTTANPFKEQFLNAYVEQISAELDAYRQMMTQVEAKAAFISTAGIETINQKIDTFLSNKITISPAADPSVSLKKISDSVSRQNTRSLNNLFTP